VLRIIPQEAVPPEGNCILNGTEELDELEPVWRLLYSIGLLIHDPLNEALYHVTPIKLARVGPRPEQEVQECLAQVNIPATRRLVLDIEGLIGLGL
jgi:hypothetical protein